jgi:hypothetical protein
LVAAQVHQPQVVPLENVVQLVVAILDLVALLVAAQAHHPLRALLENVVQLVVVIVAQEHVQLVHLVVVEAHLLLNAPLANVTKIKVDAEDCSDVAALKMIKQMLAALRKTTEKKRNHVLAVDFPAQTIKKKHPIGDQNVARNLLERNPPSLQRPRVPAARPKRSPATTKSRA